MQAYGGDRETEAAFHQRFIPVCADRNDARAREGRRCVARAPGDPHPHYKPESRGATTGWCMAAPIT
jgi:hypothetical protein